MMHHAGCMRTKPREIVGLNDQVSLNHFRSEFMRRLIDPCWYDRFIDHTPLTRAQKLKNRIKNAGERARDAWLVLTGKAEVADDD